MRKRITSLVLALLLAVAGVAITACGSDSSDGSSSSSTSSSGGGQKALKIALITNDQFDPFYVTMDAGAKQAAQDLDGISVSWQASKEISVPSQTQLLQSVIAGKPDGIVMSAVDSKAMVAPLRAAKTAGIPVVVVDADVTDPSVRLTALASDNAAGGKLAADEMSKLLGSGGGKVLYQGYKPGVQSVDLRHTGWGAGLKAHPELQSIGDQFDDVDLATIAGKTTAALRRTPDLKGIFSSYTNGGVGVATGLQQAGKAGKVKLIAFDGSPEEVNFLRRGVISALIVQDAFDMGRQGVQIIADHIRKKTTPASSVKLDFHVITKDNVDSPEAKKYLYRAAK